MTGTMIEEGHLAYNGVMGVFLEEASASHSTASKDPVESGAVVEEGRVSACRLSSWVLPWRSKTKVL